MNDFFHIIFRFVYDVPFISNLLHFIAKEHSMCGQNTFYGDVFGSLVVKTLPPNAWSTGLIPGQGAKNPGSHMPHGKKTKT